MFCLQNQKKKKQIRYLKSNQEDANEFIVNLLDGLLEETSSFNGIFQIDLMKWIGKHIWIFLINFIEKKVILIF